MSKTILGAEVQSKKDLVRTVFLELVTLRNTIKHFSSCPEKDYKQLRSYVMCRIKYIYKEIDKFMDSEGEQQNDKSKESK